ncbi:MAG: ComEC/Rec2 family competence protein [Rickettsiaceae bacterium]|nr:ComEC/Rec2 family competence protein [Rickettsiaceae bacterium]
MFKKYLKNKNLINFFFALKKQNTYNAKVKPSTSEDGFYTSYAIEFLETRRLNFVLWYCFAYLLGIYFYFYFKNYIGFALISFAFTPAILFVILAYYSNRIDYRFPASLITIFVAGTFVCKIRETCVSYSAIQDQFYNLQIEGIVSNTKPTPFGHQILLKEVKILTKNTGISPKIVRINFHDENASNILNGDRIRVNADIFPIPGQIMPGGYNLKQVAFFNGIEAIGRAKGEPEILDYKDDSLFIKVSYIRKFLYKNLMSNLGHANGNFAAALFLGETGGIDKKILSNMRNSGLSHILCVSGLHLSLVASLFFILTRFLLNLSDRISNAIDIKRVAGVIALFISFLYLILTGMQIAATRAFIMTSIVMASVIFARQPYPIRSLCFACIIILTKNPEYAILPSFQLSFIAVVSLIIGYEFYTKIHIKTSYFGATSFVGAYFFSNVYSSLIASIATGPIVMYHFYTYPNLSVIANLVAVPLVSFVTIPCGIATIFLYPFGLSFIPYYMIDLSIKLIAHTAQYISSFETAVVYTGYVSNLTIFFFIIGFLWFAFWDKKERYLGLLGMILFFISFNSQEKPSILINQESNFIAFYHRDHVTIVSDKISPFTANFIANWYGFKNYTLHKLSIDKPFCADQFIINKESQLSSRCRHFIDLKY